MGCGALYMMVEGGRTKEVARRSGGVILLRSKVGCETAVSFRFEVVGGITSINVMMVEYGKVYDGGGGFVVNDRYLFFYKYSNYSKDAYGHK